MHWCSRHLFNARHTHRLKCTYTCVSTPVRRCSNFFANKTISNFPRILNFVLIDGKQKTFKWTVMTLWLNRRLSTMVRVSKKLYSQTFGGAGRVHNSLFCMILWDFYSSSWRITAPRVHLLCTAAWSSGGNTAQSSERETSGSQFAWTTVLLAPKSSTTPGLLLAGPWRGKQWQYRRSGSISIARTQVPISLSIPFMSIEHHCSFHCYSRSRTR